MRTFFVVVVGGGVFFKTKINVFKSTDTKYHFKMCRHFNVGEAVIIHTKILPAVLSKRMPIRTVCQNTSVSVIKV